jgi:hypothetical protein
MANYNNRFESDGMANDNNRFESDGMANDNNRFESDGMANDNNRSESYGMAYIVWFIIIALECKYCLLGRLFRPINTVFAHHVFIFCFFTMWLEVHTPIVILAILLSKSEYFVAN